MIAKKGEYNYINTRKKNAIILTLIMAVIGVVIFLVGYFLNKKSNQNIFTVVAILFALPGAKFLVRFIVLFPYKSVGKKEYDDTAAHVKEGMELYTDLVITSPDKVMELDFIAVGNKQVIGLIGKEKQDVAYIRKYISDGVGNWGNGYKVKIVESQNIFLSELDSVTAADVDKEEEDNVKSFITSLIV